MCGNHRDLVGLFAEFLQLARGKCGQLEQFGELLGGWLGLWIKCLQYKDEDVSSNAQDPLKRAGHCGTRLRTQC